MNPAAGHILPTEVLTHFTDAPGFAAKAFVEAHALESPSSIRLNLKKPAGIDTSMPAVFWCPNAYYLPVRPLYSLDPLWHAGAYYVQEASSMFLHHIVKSLFNNSTPLTVLDTCAAPGGKSTLLTDALPDGSLVVSNEVVSKRAGILYENMEKWGRLNSMVINADMKQLVRLTVKFDVVVVDAPCTGSGLWRKQPDSIQEWSLKAVEECSLRQMQIVKDAWEALAPGGYLIYSTCSYSVNEDEDILDYMAGSLQAQPVDVYTNPEWGIVRTTSPKNKMPGYRFYPYRVKGEGFYAAVVQKPGVALLNTDTMHQGVKLKRAPAAKRLQGTWPDDVSLHEIEPNRLLALPKRWEHLMYHLYSRLPVKKMGIPLGEYKGTDLVPEHAWAMSELMTPDKATSYAVDLNTALAYLRKDTQWFEDMPKGWNIITYNNIPLGWVKKAENRVNNYYPPAWRLRN